jgi:DNA-binding transcriptional ArsR family regulator
MPLLGEAVIADTAYEGEAVRLKRLNEEVARIAETLSRLTRRDAGEQRHGTDFADHDQAFVGPPLDDIVIDPAEIRRAIRGRRMRDAYFRTGLFEEPGWDMLLDLFAAELERTRVSVSSLCIAAAVAPTTALRWISKLTDAGLFERRPDPFDRRRAYMELSDRGSRAMRDYVGALRRSGLSLA